MKRSLKQLGLLAFSATVLVSFQASANEDVDLMCKGKAKTIAIETFKTCVTENRSAQIEQLRRSYSEKLKALKEEYDSEIRRLGGKTKSAKTDVKTSKRLTKTRTESVEVSGVSDDSVMDIPEPIPVEKYY